MANLFTDEFSVAENGKTTILVVENVRDLAGLMVLALLRSGFVTIAAAHVDTAREWLNRHRPGIIVANLGLPDRGGFELIKLVRSTPKLTHIPIIALTNESAMSFHAAIEAGATATLQVPREINKLIGTLKQVMLWPSACAQ